jgi:hypothetical protein
MTKTNRVVDLVRIFCFIGSVVFSILPTLSAHAEGSFSSPCPVHKVRAIGAPTAGGVMEGVVGAPYQQPHHRYSCRSAGPKPGFIGPDAAGKPTCVRDQPGVFPAPLLGPDSLSFTFISQSHCASLVTPVVVRPDGTAFFGQSMRADDLPQRLEIPAPAQMGIYTLFVLPHDAESEPVSMAVEVASSEQPGLVETISLKSFVGGCDDSDLTCGEYTYYLRHKT